MAKLVRFKNGKYGVRLHWFFGWHFSEIDKYPILSFTTPFDILKHCQGTKEQAIEVIQKLDLLASMHKYKVIKYDKSK